MNQLNDYKDIYNNLIKQFCQACLDENGFTKQLEDCLSKHGKQCQLNNIHIFLF